MWQREADAGLRASFALLFLAQPGDGSCLCSTRDFGTTPAITLDFPFLQEPISDLPRFILFFISYGLQLLLFFVSGFSDIAPETKEIGKKVRGLHGSGFGALHPEHCVEQGRLRAGSRLLGKT